jgi:aldehyde dehydrogenase
MELIGDIIPAGVLNVVTGFGLEAGSPLSQSDRVAKLGFTGGTTTGKTVMKVIVLHFIIICFSLIHCSRLSHCNYSPLQRT